jgi:phage gp46-like protein
MPVNLRIRDNKMSGDIQLSYSQDLMEFDFLVTDGDIVGDEGLETAIFISLYTSMRARVDDPFDNNDRKGWWGDQTTEDNDQIGSRLWLLDRSKATIENVRLAKIYIEEALEWLVTDGVARKVEVVAERAGQPIKDRLYMEVKIYKSDGTDVTYKFDALWDAQMVA